MNIRASSLPRIIKCPASKASPEIIIDDTNEVATMGTAVHAVMERIVESKDFSGLPPIEDLTEKYGIEDEKRFYRLCFNGLEIWNALCGSVEVLETEKALEVELPLVPSHPFMKTASVNKLKLKGHPDLVGKSGENLVIIDWKSGFMEYDFSDQLMAYLVMAMERFPGFEKGKIILADLDKGKYKVKEVNEEDISRFVGSLSDTMKSDAYNPGEHCKYCPLKDQGCKAHETLVRSTASALIDLSENMGLVTPEMLADIYPKTRLMKKALDNYEKIFKSQVELKGEIISSDGKRYFMEESDQQELMPDEMIEAMAGYWKISGVESIKEFFGKLKDSVSIGKSKFLDVIGKGVERGKGAEKKEVMDMLEKEGAIKTKKRKTLKSEKA